MDHKFLWHRLIYLFSATLLWLVLSQRGSSSHKSLPQREFTWLEQKQPATTSAINTQHLHSWKSLASKGEALLLKGTSWAGGWKAMPAAPTKTSEMRFLWKCLLKLEVFNIPVYRNVLVLWPPRVCRLTQGHRTPAVGKHKAGLLYASSSCEAQCWKGAVGRSCPGKRGNCRVQGNRARKESEGKGEGMNRQVRKRCPGKSLGHPLLLHSWWYNHSFADV